MNKDEAKVLWAERNNNGLGYAPYTDVVGDETVQSAIDAAISDGWEVVIRADNSDEVTVLCNDDGDLMGIGDSNGAWAVDLTNA